MEETTASPDNIIFGLLNGLLEEKSEHIDQFLPMVVSDILTTKWRLESGLSKFIQVLSDVVADAPTAPKWFFTLVLKPMLEKGRIDLKRLNWLQPEDDIFAVGGHIQLVAQLVKHQAASASSSAKAVEVLKGDMAAVMKVLKEKMEENGEDKDELSEQVLELTGFTQDKDG